MTVSKRVLLFGMVLFALTAVLMGQTRTGNPELTVEQSYLQDTIELAIIREQSRADSREMKMVALEYISDAIERGNRSDEIRLALEHLSMEGVVNITRESGRVVNNYPDVRTRAATYLGELGTPEAKNTLLRMVRADNEPMVLTEAIKSLGNIGLNDNNETVNTIVWTATRYDNLNPDNLLALSTIVALEKLALANNGIANQAAIQYLIRVADGNYIRPVQERARQALMEIRRFNVQN